MIFQIKRHYRKYEVNFTSTCGLYTSRKSRLAIKLVCFFMENKGRNSLSNQAFSVQGFVSWQRRKTSYFGIGLIKIFSTTNFNVVK